MSFYTYLRDQLKFILFFLLVTAIVVGVVFLDRANRMLPANTTYLLVVLSVLLLLYLGADYFSRRDHWRRLQATAAGQHRDWINNLPPAATVECRLYHDLLLRLYRESNAEIEEWRRKGRQDLEFVTAWVHEVKTPLAVAHLLLQNNAPTPSPAIMENLEEELEKIEDSISRALFYSRSNDFAADYLIQPCPLERVVKESIKGHAKAFIHKNIKITLGDLSREIATDKKWLGFVLDQIVANSLKYTSRGGEVNIWAEGAKNECRLHIADNGAGITPEDLERVFQPGFTGFNGRRESKSTGLGLYLAQRVAKKLGHYLTVSSQLGAGTTLCVHFPKYTDYFDVTKM